MDRDAIAVEVRAARKANGWSQAELGRRAGLSERTIRNLEHNEPVEQGTVDDVYRALGMPARTPWPDDVAHFLEMVGARLARLPVAARHDLMHAVTQLVIDFRPHTNSA